MKKRAHGEGSIFEKDGKWYGEITLGYHTVEGKKRRDYRRVSGKSEADVARQLNKLKTERERTGTLPKRRSESLGVYLEQWLKTRLGSGDIRATTHRSYKTTIDNWILPIIGSKDLVKLTAADIAYLDAEMINRGASARTRELAYQVMRKAMNDAIDRDLVTVNPCRKIKKPRYDPKKFTVWTDEQASAFEQAARSDYYYPVFLLAMDSGMREGEILGLKPDDIDYRQGTVTIHRQLAELPRSFSLEPPKTSSGYRTIALHEHTLQSLREAQKTRALNGMLFHWNGSYVSRRHLLKHFEAVCKQAGVPRIRFHDLRHLAATRWIREGVPLHDVAYRLGHHDVSITLRTYAHVTQEQNQKAAATFGRVLA